VFVVFDWPQISRISQSVFVAAVSVTNNFSADHILCLFCLILSTLLIITLLAVRQATYTYDVFT